MSILEHNGPSVAFLRPLRSFAREKRLEQNCSATVGATQLMRVLGFPMDAMMRRHLGASGWQQLKYALAGKHKLSTTSRKLLLDKFGPLGPAFLEVIDRKHSALLDGPFAWETFVLPMDGPPDALVTGLTRAATYLGDLERRAFEARSSAQTKSPGDGRRQLAEFSFGAADAWKERLKSSTRQAALPLDSLLRALAEFDAGAGRFLGVEASYLATLLGGGMAPLFHWMQHIRRAFHVENNQALANELLRHRVLVKTQNGNERTVKRATLASWARADQLPSPGAVTPILRALPSGEQGRALTLQVEYLFARGLTFLIQALAALSEPEISEEQAQHLLLERYLALFSQAAVAI
jgi:hypothetical protein